jgi:hypothetical protein
MHSAERLEIVEGTWFAKFSAPLPLVAVVSDDNVE